MKDQKKKKVNIVGVIAYLFLGSVMGTLYMYDSSINFWLQLLLIILETIFAVYIQTFVHEFGHLLFGLFSGYRFLSFRVGSTIFIRLNGKVYKRRYVLPGTLGQCLMAPPKKEQGKFHFVMYHLGGILMNALLSSICIIFCVKSTSIFFYNFFLIIGEIGIYFFGINGFPFIGNPDISNDGKNILEQLKDPASKEAIWNQLRIVELQTEGLGLKEMPEALFEAPEENTHTQVLALLATKETRALFSQDYEKAKELQDLLIQDTTPAILLNALKFDKITQSLIETQTISTELLEWYESKDTQAYIKLLSENPLVLRTRYAMQHLYYRKEEDQVIEQFVKMRERYAYPSEVAEEWELMEVLHALTPKEEVPTVETSIEEPLIEEVQNVETAKEETL